ncbi:MAG: hypothetical protein KDD35_03675 [Bdellovibrionales bacterium]|nr:hypothetical protein [Bdellovibrionales bacterium]
MNHPTDVTSFPLVSEFDVFEWSQKWAQKQTDLFLQAWMETDSTNNQAKQNLLPDNFQVGLYLTRHQSHGRGRYQRVWRDGGLGQYLLSSWVFRMFASPQHLTGPIFGLALYRALKKQFPKVQLGLKAPNDILISNKKVAGILIETLSFSNQYFLIVGIGLNVFAAPHELDEAASLASSQILDAQSWLEFLDRLYFELTQAVQLCARPQLERSEQNELRLALNCCIKDNADEILEVTPEGNLLTKDACLPWTNL